MWIRDKAVEFFGTGAITALVETHQLGWKTLGTLPGIEALIAPIFPWLLILEMAFLVWVNRRSASNLSLAYKTPILMFSANRIFVTLIGLQIFATTATFFSKLAPFTVPAHLGWFVYAFLVWEFSHFVYHYTSHKVRLLWCFHAPHHAPTHINLSVIYTSFFLQGTYATFIRTAICSVLGVPLPLFILCAVIDGCWGALIHFSEELWPSGKLPGPLGRLILNPSHHRVHHASNPEYLDKNYCNTLPIWDKVFGTLQHQIPEVKPKYGLNREVKPNSFMDMYIGEIYLLAKDVHSAPTLKQKLLHIFMPPGWHPEK